MSTRLIPAAALLAFLAPGCGDGPKTYKVTGAVTWQGTPVADGQINFLPADGSVHPATAKIANGRYEARVPAGSMKVEVYAERDLGFNKAMNQNVKESYIPPEYNALSTLTLDVQPNDANTADFHLPLRK
jgi:hypothetical protein